MASKSERLQIAAQCLQGLVGFYGYEGSPFDHHVGQSIKLADKLIAAIDASEPKPQKHEQDWVEKCGVKR